ncbi:Abi-alpha family protein [Agrobacterium sp. CG674]
MGENKNDVPDIVLLKSEIEAAAARVAEKAMNDTWGGFAAFSGDVFGGLVGDRIKQWRTRNLIDVLAKTRDHLAKHGVSIENAKTLPMGEVYAIFEGASKTDDVDLSDMWAALLSNEMNPSNKTSVDPSFQRILSELSGLDARIMHYLKRHENLSEERQSKRDEVLKPKGVALSNEEKERLDIVEKLNFIKVEYEGKQKAARDEIVSHYSTDNISYSVSSLVRLGLINNGSGGYAGDTLVQAGMRRGEIELDTSGLRSELQWVWERFDMMSEDNRPMPNLWYPSSVSKGMEFPNYSLTGLAERLLHACS